MELLLEEEEPALEDELDDPVSLSEAYNGLGKGKLTTLDEVFLSA